jgi:hypothetical protein
MTMKGPAVFFAEIENADDVFVADVGRGASFEQEAGFGFVVRCPHDGQELQCDLAAQHSVARSIDVRHPAPEELL